MSKADQAAMDGQEAYRRLRRFARECAVQFLYQADIQESGGADLEREFSLYWEQVIELGNLPVGCPPEPARQSAWRLSRGVIDNLAALDDAIAGKAHNWRLGRMSAIDRNILRLATYEIMFCPDIPPVVSVDEAIELAKEFGDRDSGRFVNGVLDQIVKGAPQAEP